MAVGENMVKLVDAQKREREDVLERMTQFFAKLDKKQALEKEIVEIRGLVEVMKLMIDGGVAADAQALEALEQQLKDKQEQLAGIQ